MATWSWIVRICVVATASGFSRTGRLSSHRHGSVCKAASLVDLDVLANTLDFESDMALRGLQAFGPAGPWHEVESLPSHKFRTMNLKAKFRRIMCELPVARPAEAVAVLRLLFEEEEVTTKGTRPLTVGEIVENWHAVIAPRCDAAWQREGWSVEDLDVRLADLYADEIEALAWRQEAVSAFEGIDVVLVVRGDGAFRGARNLAVPGLDDARALVIASPCDIAEGVREANATTYFAGNTHLAFYTATSLDRRRCTVYHCNWISRWDGPRTSLSEKNDLGIRILETERRDLRHILRRPS